MPKTIAVMYKPLPDERGFGVTFLPVGEALLVVALSLPFSVFVAVEFSSCEGLASFMTGRQPF